MHLLFNIQINGSCFVEIYVKKKIQQSEVDFQFGVMVDGLGDEDLVVVPVDCPLRDRVFSSQRVLRIHCGRSRGERRQARKFVVGPVRSTCNAKFVTRNRVVDHMLRGVLACMVPWRFGCFARVST